MKQGLRVLAVIPARGGTDRVPYLNIKRLGDKPLLAHTIDAAKASAVVDRVVVSTDDARVAEIARRHGADVPFLRPASLAGDIPSLKPVVVHAVEQCEKDGAPFEVVVVLQVTTPYRDAAAIDEAVARLVDGGFDSVVSVTEDRTLAWRADAGHLKPLFERAGRRDEQPPVFRENGAVVAMRRPVIDAPTRFGERIGYLALDKRQAFTVYDLEDFWMAERLLRTPRILFRVDGSAKLGMGHVYRSLAIANELRDSSRAEIAFLMTTSHAEGLAKVSSYGYTVYPVRLAGEGQLDVYLEHIRDYAPEILINDLPALEDSYLRALGHLGTTTVNLVDNLDDLERTGAYAQMIVSVMSDERETPEGFYGGPAYAILRRHFSDRQATKELRAIPRTVLLSFGGSDPQGLTLKAARALQGLPSSVDVVAVAGPAFSYRREFDALAQTLSRRIPLIQQAEGHIVDLMLEADVVVCSGGMTVYEIAALGTPGLVLAQNLREESRMRAFASHGTVEFLGLGSDVSEAEITRAASALLGDLPRRTRMSEKGRTLVDGMGAARAAELVLGSVQKKETEGARR